MPAELSIVLWDATLQTLSMVAGAAVISTILGFPLGVVLATSAKGGLFAAPSLNRLLSIPVNLACAIPFIVLALALFPLVHLVTGTSAGTLEGIAILTVAAAPFIAKSIESAIREVDRGLVEESLAMGATRLQIVRKVLLPEAKPSILPGFTVALVSLIGNAIIAGAVGGGGLGALGIRFGYERFSPEIMAAALIITIALVQTIQILGERLARRGKPNRGHAIA
jgi:D-methionine transport system permease protein